MLLRHAKAVRAELGDPDRKRVLAERGRKQAPEIGAFMARHKLLPERALVSPSARTRETWELVAPALRKAPAATLEERMYNADADALLDMVRETEASVRSLVLVGHNPGLHELAVMLVATGAAELREQLAEKLPTGGLVVIEFPVAAWHELNPSSGRLQRYVTPKMIESETD
jgi:phosphohistidine phosphatase